MQNILIVEDSKFINNTISKRLKELNYNVSQAFTLKSAEDQLISKNFDFVILDLHLPDGDGIDLLTLIKTLNNTRVIVLTSSTDLQVREELFRYGILDYIIKDGNLLYSIEQVIKVIKRIEENDGDKILVIDDSRIVCRQIKNILTPRNYEIDVSKTAKEGLEKVKQNDYTLIILDLNLPDIDGMVVLNRLRKDKRLLMTPVIVLSGTITPTVIRDVLKNGANDFIQKPFVFEEFILKVDIWADYYKKEKKIEEMSKKLEEMNNELQELVQKEIEKNREKDKLMFLQARHAQLGEAMSIIAHQWKQPLNAISITATTIGLKSQMGKLSDSELLELVSKINKYTKNLSQIIDEFRDFFKPKNKKTKTTLKKIVQKAKELLDPILKEKNIPLKVEINDESEIEVFENELVQVVVNIVMNAVDAIEEKGVKNPQVKISVDQHSIYIEDNAGGISEEIIDKIFEPYFSTKSLNGTGLGLYMAKIIVENHCGGSLSVENVQNGARFVIKCP